MFDFALPPPTVIAPTRVGPVIVSVPHSGREIPAELARAARGGDRSIERLADPYVDFLVEPLLDEGHGAVIARAPRAAIDVNRSVDACDPQVHLDAAPPPADSKAARGLGIVIGRGVDGKPLWRDKLPDDAFERWLDSAWHPYHRALEDLIDRTRARHGVAILLDCHSMPPLSARGPFVVIGDRFGQSAAPWVSGVVEALLEDRALPHATNRPYAGGEIAAAHGRPADNVHVLQIEIDRSLYLDRNLRRPGAGIGRIQSLLTAMAARLEDAAQSETLRAAE
ncbi:N-formylglutamate amidohydrolase [Sphingomicrobium sp. XHP0239]|uniref:N-formylglutamate amidohydrolase n=1 Tax=Sphingomicrobium maritimum TaxID=3133972 RepID=UPI0031CCCBFD